MAATTVLEIMKSIVNIAASNYSNYGAKPTIKIEGTDNLSKMKPGHIGIVISEGVESPEFTCDGTPIFTSADQRSCKVRLAEKTANRLDNLYTDVKDICKDNSSYSVLFDHEIDYLRPLYIKTMRVRIL